MKTIDDVRARFAELQKSGDDFFGFEREALMEFLPEHWKHEGVPEDHQHKCPELTEENVRRRLLEYLDFAFDKALNHRGISANRSVQKLGVWCWILGRADLVAVCADGSLYTNYGVPILKRVAHAFDVTPPQAITDWPDGESCEPGCQMGCGQ